MTTNTNPAARALRLEMHVLSLEAGHLPEGTTARAEAHAASQAALRALIAAGETFELDADITVREMLAYSRSWHAARAA